MAVGLSTFGITLAAICIWLTVRIVNRRERWAKWTLAATAVLALYVQSWIPMARLGEWLASHDLLPDGAGIALAYFYLPMQIAIRLTGLG